MTRDVGGLARRGRRGLALAAALALALSAGGASAPGGEQLRTAKALFFDGQYADARGAWETVRAGGGDEARDALFWIARCSENLGELTRALDEYGRYLATRPTSASLVEEARTARASVAARLYKSGAHQHLHVLHEALDDPARNVRAFAALQLSQLGPEAGAPAIPVLRAIVTEEKDPELVDRAKLGLLRLDPKALSDAPAGTGGKPRARSIAWIKVRIFEHGRREPTVSVNLPVALADLVFKSLPDDARDALKRKGYDADNFWTRLKKLGPTEIVTIQGDGGERIQIWTE